MTHYIIIEGPDCVGKGYFIEQFKQYMQRPVSTRHDIDKADPEWIAELRMVIDQQLPTANFPVLELAKVTLDRLEMPRPTVQPLSVAVAEISAATVENKEFTRKIHAGGLTQDEIADEYLQVIYDHFNYAKLLGQTHDIVLMDRSLPSYYAYQISSLGYERKLPHWLQLYKLMTDELDFSVIHLDAPVEVLAKRKALKKGVSVLDDIYFERIDKIRSGYAELYKLGYFPQHVVINTDITGEHPYDHVFRELTIKIITASAPI